jgi:ABC-2 type transport system permease protein
VTSLPVATPPRLAEAKPLTFADHVVNIFHLVIKELRSIRADPVMLLLVVYSFSISVNTVATGAVTEATNLSVGIVDEDGSDLSRQIAEGLRAPTFQPPVHITASDMDPMMDQGKLLFVVEIPPNFEADIRAQRKTGIQINVDATAVAQAGNGAGYLSTAIANEIQRFTSGGKGSTGPPINLVVRAAFNPNLRTSWFSAMTQVINQITLLTVILTGAALIRERDQGTVEHLLVMPVVPTEIMLAKMIANGLVILVAAMLSLQFVVHWWIGSPINGSILLFLLGTAIYALVVAALGILLGTLATTMGQFWPTRHTRTDRHAIALRQQHADGEHARLAAISDQDDQPDPAFRLVRAGGAVPRRRHHAGVAGAGGDARDRRCLFHRRQRPLPQGDLRRLIAREKTSRIHRRSNKKLEWVVPPIASLGLTA